MLIVGAAAPKLVTREMLKLIPNGAVLVDVAVDQGGCFETTHATVMRLKKRLLRLIWLSARC